MAASNKNRTLLKERLKIEQMLIDSLSEKNGIPTDFTLFMKFVRDHFDEKLFTDSVIESVWEKLINSQKAHSGLIESFELSSDENENINENENMNDGNINENEKMNENVQVVELMDFDVPSEGPEYKIIEISQEMPKASVKRERRVKKKTSSPSKNKLKREEESRDRDLLKKFRKQIILEELLKRDQEMLKVYNSNGDVSKAVSIEMEYTNRIQKDKVDLRAQEMLNNYKLGLSLSAGESLDETSLSLVIPCQSVIAEVLPSGELYSDAKMNETTEDMDFVYNPENAPTPVLKPSDKRSRKTRKSYPQRSSKRKKKNDSPDCEVLRREIILDKLIELALPEVVEKRNNFLQRHSIS